MSSTSPNANPIASPHSVSSDLSPPSSTATISPPWAPPRSPLPPYRLAKIANALGVSTPMPAIHYSSPFAIHRSRTTSPTPSDAFGRSMTPSTLASSSSAYSNPISKYLLHVIPPQYLPHDIDNDNDMTQPPATASGYHTQFHRGILVPVHSTLQSQLGAIAKEYALPSTAGLILYLVSSAPSPNNHQSAHSKSSMTLLDGVIPDEPGPRLSEDIWKYLWTRVSKAEQRDDMLVSPSIGAPLGMTLSARSTPYLHQDLNGHSLRPFLSANETPSHLPPSHFPSSPTTASTVSDIRSNAKSTQPSASSVGDPETPDTSSAAPSFLLQDPATRANSLDLPGLISPSIIPVLAKVEFDIDRRKATWYEPWLRSRRLNHAKRAESRNGRRVEGAASVSQESDNVQDQGGHIKLLTGTDSAASLSVVEKPTLATKEIVLEQTSPQEELNDDENRWSDDSDDDEDFEPTARVALVAKHNDSSQSVFEDDEEVSSPSDYGAPTSGEDEVEALLNEMSRSNLSISITAPEKRSSSPTGAKKHVPPPLVLVPGKSANDLVIPAGATPSPSPVSSAPSSAGLAYLKDGESEESLTERQHAEDNSNDLDVDYTRIRTPEETEKRGGAVFDDLDLGLDPTEDYDDDDPHDRRRSQFIMRAQLDEIERTMAQLSPRNLQADLAEEQNHGPPFSPNSSLSLSPGKLNGDYYPSSPRLPQHPEPDVTEMSRSNSQATRFSISRVAPKNSSPPRRNLPPSPPRLALNGVATSSPKTDVLDPGVLGLGRRDPQGHIYPEMSSADLGDHADSPIIPLSPDPFGRFSSTPPASVLSQQPNRENESVAKASPGLVASLTPQHESSNGPETRKRSQSTATSRFSADSMTVVESNPKSSNRTTLGMNAFKKLWRKSSKPSDRVSRPPTPNGSSMPPVRPERPSQDFLNDRPKTPTGRYSPQPMPPRQPHDMQPPVPVPQGSPLLPPSPNPQQSPYIPQPPPPRQPGPIQHPMASAIPPPQPQAYPAGPPPFNGRNVNPQPIVAAQMRPSRSASQLDRLHFDQESPYPTRRHPSFSRPASPPPAPSPQIQSTHLPSATPTTPMGGAFPPLGPPIVLQERDRSSVRKSILKGWKSSSISSTTSVHQPPLSTTPEPRTSMERPGSGASRGRRPSVLNFGSTRSSATSPLPDIPPSPQIPQRFVPGGDNRQSIRSRLTNSSVDLLHSPPRSNNPLSTASSSPRRSIASSHGSRESRPSFDTSQFEIVSPKGSALTYPYHGLDHSP